MAILNTQTIESISNNDLEQLSSKTLIRSFGQNNDSIELTISDQNGKVLVIDEFFNDYTPYYNAPGTQDDGSKINSIDINYEQVLSDYGYTSGTYIMTFSFQRKILFNNIKKLFYIDEISPSRREIRVKSDILSDNDFGNAINRLSGILNQTSYIRDVNFTFGNNNVILVLNSFLDKNNTGLVKLYNPLPLNLGINSRFRVFEEIINPLEVTVQLQNDSLVQDTGIDIGSPNFNLKNNDIFTVPSGYKTFDQILSNGSVSSSFNNVQNLLSASGAQIDLEFDNIDTPSGFHFENFIHFSSATERLKNFKYKLGLLEQYSNSIDNLNNITGSVSSSNFVYENIEILRNKENKLLQGFDYYERYLYYESGTYAWPKTNNTCPYINAPVESAAAVSWFGAPIDDYESAYYGGQMLSASKFDDCNPYNLVNTIPPHIQDNQQNDKYVLFVEMIAQHFDSIWAYIDSITDINEAHSGLKDGISKDLVLNQLTSRGISAYDQFSNSSIYEYLIGDDGTSTFEYTPTDGSTLISASNCPIPKGDIAKEIWKRLYHNSSYLLKTKGTERGLKALIACYGIPETVLHVKEYGGPLMDKTGFRTFSYQKESKTISPPSLGDGAVVDTAVPVNTKTLQVRFLPDQNSTQFDVLSIADGDPFPGTGLNDFSVGVSQSLNPAYTDSGSFAHLVIASGSNNAGGSAVVTKASSSLGPILNGDVWNLSVVLNSGSAVGNNVVAYATNTTYNKNTYVLSCSLDLTNYFDGISGFTTITAGNNTAQGSSGLKGTLLGPFTGSIQEYRAWFETLTEDTIVTQSLSPFNYNGNTISSSYESLYLRLPLGSDNQNPLRAVAINNAPKSSYQSLYSAEVPTNATVVSIEETHHLTTPDTVGSGMVSDKVRIDNGTFDDNFLDPFISVETSPQDRQPLDYSDLGVFFSPTFELNEDIIYTLGGFRLDDYIGDPTHFTSGSYPDLKSIKDIYFQKVNKNRPKFNDYIRTIQFFDHTLFKMIKEFTPAKANLKTGLVIEPHYLERTKIAGTNVDYEQKIEHLAFYTPSGSITSTSENINDVLIDVVDYIESGSYTTANENVAQTNKKSKYYSLK